MAGVDVEGAGKYRTAWLEDVGDADEGVLGAVFGARYGAEDAGGCAGRENAVVSTEHDSDPGIAAHWDDADGQGESDRMVGAVALNPDEEEDKRACARSFDPPPSEPRRHALSSWEHKRGKWGPSMLLGKR